MKTAPWESVVNYRIAIPSSVALAMKGILTKKLRRSKIKVRSNKSYNVLDHSIHITIFCSFKSYKN